MLSEDLVMVWKIKTMKLTKKILEKDRVRLCKQFLVYCSLKVFKLSIVDVGKIFGLSRQQIYNILKGIES